MGLRCVIKKKGVHCCVALKVRNLIICTASLWVASVFSGYFKIESSNSVFNPITHREGRSLTDDTDMLGVTRPKLQ